MEKQYFLKGNMSYPRLIPRVDDDRQVADRPLQQLFGPVQGAGIEQQGVTRAQVVKLPRVSIDHLARMTGKPKEAVLREVVETGLKSYPPIPTKGIKALVDLAEWAEKHHSTDL